MEPTEESPLQLTTKADPMAFFRSVKSIAASVSARLIVEFPSLKDADGHNRKERESPSIHINSMATDHTAPALPVEWNGRTFTVSGRIRGNGGRSRSIYMSGTLSDDCTTLDQVRVQEVLESGGQTTISEFEVATLVIHDRAVLDRLPQAIPNSYCRYQDRTGASVISIRRTIVLNGQTFSQVASIAGKASTDLSFYN